MNAEFLRGIGLDPNKVTSDPVTVTPLDHERIMVNYQGFVMVTAEQMAAALKAAAKVTRPVDAGGAST